MADERGNVTPSPPARVLGAFVAAEEVAEDEWRSECRVHDSAGPVTFLFGRHWPLAMRWEQDLSGVRVTAHYGTAAHSYAELALHCERAGLSVRRCVGDHQLFSVLRGRSVPRRTLA